VEDGSVKRWLGLLRSFLVYWRPGRQRALRRLYAPLVGSGDLVFDIGAHLGDRTAAFAALGARVIAFEPQPHVVPWLRRLSKKNPRITVRAEAVGSTPGVARLSVSRVHPTVSTLSDAWRARVTRANPGFRAVRWDETVEVTVVTLDEVIATHGVPRFCKIDVEGFEAEVLAGLSQPLPALSVEFVSGDLETSVACVAALQALGDYEFNAIAGEGRSFLLDRWRSASEMTGWLEGGAEGFASGDLYARHIGAVGTSKGGADV